MKVIYSPHKNHDLIQKYYARKKTVIAQYYFDLVDKSCANIYNVFFF